MDSFETIRNLAARLHADLVAKGLDPLDPTAIVRAAAAHYDLELTFLPPGDPALKGARAVFDGQSGTILCEDRGAAVERALLAAHEIGHGAAHQTTSACNDEDIDPSRSTEAAPVGLQKVEDYGARERRELEANVFARELLFPRPFARRLHVTEELTSAQIAEKTGLPPALIRQQILDVLLLPPISSEATSKPTAPPREDKVQDRAAAHRGSPFQLQAGPGTGKTRTLVKRVQSLLADNIDPQSILILTFSNRTAGELSERLAAALPEDRRGVWIGTFHAFGLDLVRRFHDRLGLPPDPVLFDRSDAIAVLEEILPTLPLRHYRNIWDPVIVLRDILQAIARAKDELVGPDEYRRLAQQMLDKAQGDDDARTAAEKCLEVADIYARYESAKAARKGVDFGDLIMMPALLLERDAVARQAVRLRHRHVLVDEYQDVNRASVRLVKAVAGEGKHLWVVGDARQSIYRFRGASSVNMALFATDFPAPTVDQLGIGYRSTQKIVDTFVQFSRDMGAGRGMQPLALTADRGAGLARPQLRRFRTLDDEAAGVAASVLELQQAGVSFRDQAVLCRTNRRLNEIAAALEARGIPVLHLGSLFERDEVRDLLALLSLAVDPYGAGLVRIAAMERYGISMQDAARLIAFLKESDRPALRRLGDLPSAPGLSPEAVESMKRLMRDVDSRSSSSSPWDLLTTYLIDRTGLARTMAAGTTVGDQMRCVALWQFLNFLRDHPVATPGSPIRRTLDRVRNLVLLAEERDLRQVPSAALQMDAVRLMTVHGSKGLEFEAVHIPGLTVASTPSSYRGARCPPPEGMIAGAKGSVDDDAKRAHAEEEECLFFVAMSRARTHLRLYLAQRQPNGNERKPSPYLPRIQSHLDEIAAPPTLPLPAGTPRPEPISLVLPPGWPLTDQRLAAYEKCPRRFFYTHVLGIGAARRTTPFDKAHNCIHDLIDWLSKEQIGTAPTLEQAEAALDHIWQEKGPTDHAYAEDYRRLASRLVAGLIRAGAGRRFRESQPLAVDLANGSVLVEPDEIAEREDGVVVIRRLRTGRKSQDEYDKIEYTLYARAAATHFGDRAVVEAVHLSDDAREEVPITARKMQNRIATADRLLQGIAAGEFPPVLDAFTCPRCPHFFICAAAPKGGLTVE